MTQLTTVAGIEAVLAKYIPKAKEITGKNLNLERMEPLMAALGNPEKKLKIIHVAGTSGKTSTSYYVASLLSTAGYKTGLTISPHVDSVLERVQINMKPLTVAEFAVRLNEIIAVIEEASIEPTYFELLVAFAYSYFAKIGVDYAIIETGLGGLLDGSNIARNPDKLCVITDIGLDHMHVLGNTVPEIARQKAGIIHEDNQVIMYRQPDEVMSVFKDWCQQKHADLHIIEQDIISKDNALPPHLEKLPQFQQRNWLLAHEAYSYLQTRDNLPVLSPEQLIATMDIQVPGRMDTVSIAGKDIIMDGAHNEQKTTAFVDSFLYRYPGLKVPVLLSLKEGKEFAAVLPLLKPITSELIITTFAAKQDLPSLSIDPGELATAARKFGFEQVVVEPNQQAALQKLLDSAGPLAVITGSFYLIGQLRGLHKGLKNG